MTVYSCPNAVTTKVSDGDSWWMTLDLGWRTARLVNIRLHGYDAPGREDPVAKAVTTARVKELLLPGSVPVVCSIVSVRLDVYGRSVADVFLPDGRSVGPLLALEGLVVPWDGHGPHPVGGGA